MLLVADAMLRALSWPQPGGVALGDDLTLAEHEHTERVLPQGVLDRGLETPLVHPGGGRRRVAQSAPRGQYVETGAGLAAPVAAARGTPAFGSRRGS